jgi:hypothetical protein
VLEAELLPTLELFPLLLAVPVVFPGFDELAGLYAVKAPYALVEEALDGNSQVRNWGVDMSLEPPKALG